jgi:N utilization substance protein A
VVGVRIDEENNTASVTVPERMLSLAIGREGQNARLAARLTGRRIDIRSDVQQAGPAAAPVVPADEPFAPVPAAAEPAPGATPEPARADATPPATAEPIAAAPTPAKPARAKRAKRSEEEQP